LISPHITNQFHSLQDVGWYGSAYLLCSTSLQPTYGKIYQNFSLKWVFVFVVSTFEIGSLICGVAPSSLVFIIGRAIAGLGAGGIFAGALTIIAYSIPLRKRPIFTGCIGAMFGVIQPYIVDLTTL
jgi:MFS family permease